MVMAISRNIGSFGHTVFPRGVPLLGSGVIDRSVGIVLTLRGCRSLLKQVYKSYLLFRIYPRHGFGINKSNINYPNLLTLTVFDKVSLLPVS